MRDSFLELLKEKKVYFLVLGIVWAIYGIVTILAPGAEAVTRYGLTLFQTNLLRVTILLPYLLIWAASLYSVLHFHAYTKLIKISPEKKAFENITLGLMFLFAEVVLPAFVNLIGAYFPDSFTIQKIVTVVRNDLTVLLYLFSFYFLWQASREFLKIFLQNSPAAKPKYEIVSIVTALLSVIFIFCVISNPYRTSSPTSLIKPTYYLNDLSIFITIVIPYIIVWLLGLLTIKNIRTFATEVQGVIYKKTFSATAKGLSIIISLVIALQFLSQATTFFGHAHISIILLIIYIIFFLIAGGYLYLAKAANALTSIEKI
jgi:hypothetical protein